ncbi:MAG: diguanylate cyclase [Desulfobacterales bacterium]|nr:diguanylate cyclase [Desulfobacterales bacterium]
MNLVINKEKLKQIQTKKQADRTYTIMVVDDELVNLEALTLILEKEYHVVKANNGVEALTIINQDPQPERINLILSDQRMPVMMGVEFLKQTIPLIPRTIRILLTGYTDVNDIIEAINEGKIYKFLTKPIDPIDLLVSIKRALEAYDLEMQKIRLIEQLRHMNDNLEKIVAERTRQLEDSLMTLKKQKDDLEYMNGFKDRLVNELQNLSLTDPLTGIANRRKLEEVAKIEWGRGLRTKKELSMIMADIDYFKHYNDFYGHAMGDECIKRIAGIIQQTLKRPTDLVVRYGGEEFCCILPETNFDGALKIAENILQAVQSESIVHERSKVAPYVTLSLGAHTVMPENNNSWQELLRYADQYLYDAKNKGRNRVEYNKENQLGRLGCNPTLSAIDTRNAYDNGR